MSLTFEECRELRKLAKMIFQRAKELDMSYWDLAVRANMWYTTVWKLGTNRSIYPRASTILALAKAVGMEIKFNTKVELKLRAV